jgi:thiol-disulfide isomerase/thioredoxin
VNSTQPDFYQVCDLRGYPLFADLYLEPGDTINVRLTKDDNGRKTKIEGARSDAYSYYDLLDSARQADPIFAVSYRDLAVMSIDSASAQLDNRLRKERALVRSHFDGHPEWKPVAQFVKDQRDYEVLGNYFSYLYYHNYYANDTFLYLIPDPSYYHFLDSIDLSRSPEYYFWQYPDFLTSFLEDKVEHDHGNLPDSIYWADKLVLMFESAKKNFSGRTRDAALLALTSDFSHALEHPDCFDRMAAMEAYFIEHHTSEDLLRKFQHVCRVYEAFKPGNPVPDLALPDVNGDTVRLSDLRGKVLYIDFWGSWCYPCLQELPHSLSLEEKL